MSEIETGGPAFPTENAAQTGSMTWRYEGMTLRDYFAAKYIAGYMANPGDGFSTREQAAQEAYLMADALLAARGKQ